MTSSRALIVLVLLLLLAMAVGWYFFIRRTPGDLSTLIVNDRVFKIEVAETLADRAQGLSGRDGLRDDEGMLFVFPIAGHYSFWMKDMKFAIDMIWIRNSRIVGVTKDVQPEPGKAIWQLTSYPPPEAVDMVFEVSAGGAERAGMKVGDLVVLGDEKVQ